MLAKATKGVANYTKVLKHTRTNIRKERQKSDSNPDTSMTRLKKKKKLNDPKNVFVHDFNRSVF